MTCDAPPLRAQRLPKSRGFEFDNDAGLGRQLLERGLGVLGDVEIGFPAQYGERHVEKKVGKLVAAASGLVAPQARKRRGGVTRRQASGM